MSAEGTGWLLASGQHRLKAVAETGIGFVATVLFIADEATAAPGGGVTIEADGKEVRVTEGRGPTEHPDCETQIAALTTALDEERRRVVELEAALIEARAEVRDQRASFDRAWCEREAQPVVVAIPSEIHDALADTLRDAVAALLTAAGLGCAKADPTTRHGVEVDLRTVERASAAKVEG